MQRVTVIFAPKCIDFLHFVKFANAEWEERILIYSAIKAQKKIYIRNVNYAS